MAAQESMGLSWKPDIDFNCAVCMCVPHHLCSVLLCKEPLLSRVIFIFFPFFSALVSGLF